MAHTAEQTDLFEHARRALPRFLFQSTTAVQEMLWGAAVILAAAKSAVADWLTQAYITTSTGVWLDQHARDRGLARQAGETDATLRERIRRPTDAVTPVALLAAINAILATDPTTSRAVVTLTLGGWSALTIPAGSQVSSGGHLLTTLSDVTLAPLSLWVTGTTYAPGDCIYDVGGRGWQCVVGGTSTTSPLWTTGCPRLLTTADGLSWAFIGSPTLACTYAAKVTARHDEAAVTVAKYTVDTIETSISGWNGVTNVEASAVPSAALVDLRGDRAFLITPGLLSGTDDLVGGAFGERMDGSSAAFTGREVGDLISISGSGVPGMDGSFRIVSFFDYVSPTPVWSPPAVANATGVNWSIGGRKAAYLSRGYRMGTSGRPSKLIVILPYGTAAATVASIADCIRVKRASGFAHAIEVRQNP